MIEIELLHREIRECHSCRSAGFQTEPLPLVSGNAPAPFMLIGQAPSRTDRLMQHMYTGPAAQRLFEWLKSAGFVDEDFGTILYLTALTKCFPGRLPGKSTDRAPSAPELRLCADWLVRQIYLVKPDVIILFGKMAIDRFLGPGSMTDRIGNSYEVDKMLFVPLPHSSGASTWLNDTSNRARLQRALELIREAREMYPQGPSRAPLSSRTM